MHQDSELEPLAGYEKPSIDGYHFLRGQYTYLFPVEEDNTLKQDIERKWAFYWN